MNTEELMLNYHNLSRTFDMTQAMGVTMGQDCAEKLWKSRGSEDLAYYNYAIRKIPLEYVNASGKGTHYVSLRDCYKISVRDNLVTLTERSNPDPGESRTGQICTIQGTDIGVPKDMLDLEQFHDPTLCDGTPNCHCMRPTVLGKESFRRVLLDPSDEESEAMQKLHQLCKWGLKKIWREINAGTVN